MYKCGWNGCEKAYGTLNHLNAHVTMQSHGNKRVPEGKPHQRPGIVMLIHHPRDLVHLTDHLIPQSSRKFARSGRRARRPRRPTARHGTRRPPESPKPPKPPRMATPTTTATATRAVRRRRPCLLTPRRVVSRPSVTLLPNTHLPSAWVRSTPTTTSPLVATAPPPPTLNHTSTSMVKVSCPVLVSLRAANLNPSANGGSAQ